jgi:membrane associated rhomboid family serine protease
VRRRHRLGPLFMAIVVLGFIGFPNVVPGEERPPGEPQVDVMAHACGFVAGALLGLSLPRDIGGMVRVQRLAALLVPLALVAAWALALG